MRKKVTLYILVLSILLIGIIGLSGCGSEGKSAYEIWLDLGNVGTEQDFIDSLKVQGEEGSQWLYGRGAPSEYLGKKGDLYLDLDSCNVYAKEANGWTFKVCIKGETQTQTVIRAGEVYEYKLNSPLEEGLYEIEMDLGETRLKSGGSERLQAKASDWAMSDICYSEKRSRLDCDGYFVQLHNIYFGYVYIKPDATKIDIYAIGRDITFYGDVCVRRWESPTLSLGKDIECPVCVTTMGFPWFDEERPYYKVNFDRGLPGGEYRIRLVSEGDTIEDSVADARIDAYGQRMECCYDLLYGPVFDPDTDYINMRHPYVSDEPLCFILLRYNIRNIQGTTADTTTPVVIRLVKIK